MPVLSSLLAAQDPARPAIHYGGEVVSFADLLQDSARVAGGLRALGIGAGDRIGLWLPNIPAWLVLFFACARLGAIAVSVNTRFRAEEVEDIVSRSGCRLLALWPQFNGIDFDGILRAVDPAALTALERLIVYREGEPMTVAPGFATTAYGDLLIADPAAEDTGTADERCVIFTTSGTTRAPKFVCHVQRTVVQHAGDAASALDLREPGALVLQALPLCGVFGFTQALAAVSAGVPMIMLPLFDADSAAQTVRTAGVTHMYGVDDMIERMLAARSEARPFPTLRHFGYAAFNPALEDIVARAEHRGVCVRGLYGMSECLALFALQPLGLPLAERRKGGGAPVSSRAEVRVRDPATGECLPPGAAGEIEIKGPSLMHEYFGDEAATRAAFTDDGFLRTGDLGYLEGDGRFCYVARLGDVLRLSGFLTSPLEIEAVIDRHPTVASSQVVAIDLDGSPVAVAFVRAAAGAAVPEAELIAFCRTRLAGYKVPRRVFTIDEFPTTLSANGTKIQKSRLRAMAYERAAAPGDETSTSKGN